MDTPLNLYLSGFLSISGARMQQDRRGSDGSRQGDDDVQGQGGGVASRSMTRQWALAVIELGTRLKGRLIDGLNTRFS